MENKLFDLAAKRRSVRRYNNEHISDEVLNEIMKVALTAPCSFGHRPVEFVIVRDKIRELAECKSLGGSQIIGADAVIVVKCEMCGLEFETNNTRAKYCIYCRDKAQAARNRAYAEKKKSGNAVKIGSEQIWPICGKTYTVTSGAQKYCKECAVSNTLTTIIW